MTEVYVRISVVRLHSHSIVSSLILNRYSTAFVYAYRCVIPSKQSQNEHTRRMSGFEVIGVVLATIPLFISASEHYSDVRKSVEKIKHKRRTLEKYLTSLGTELVILQLRLQNLIADMNLDTALKAKLASNAGSEDWKCSEVQKEIAVKFGDATMFFMGLMQRISEGLLGELQKDDILQLSCRGKVRN